MDDELFRRLYKLAGEVASKDTPPRGTHSDFAVLMTLLRAAGQDKPISWACRRDNWPLWAWRLARRLPSPSTMSRRPHTPAFQRLLLNFNDRLRRELPGASKLKFLDGRPLLVGGFSRDRQAKRGKVPGGSWGRGYKLHAIVDACGTVESFCVTALDAGEATVARELLLGPCAYACDLRGATLLADANYDSNPLYGAVADKGGHMLAPRRKPGTGLGHHGPQHPDRLAAIEALEGPPTGRGDGRSLYHLRQGIEQVFGLMGNCPGGLPVGLPNHVRGLRRVRMWVVLKVTLYHAYLLHQDQRREAA